MNHRDIVINHPTNVLEDIEEDLEGCHDLIPWFGREWRKERLRAVQKELDQRAWATTQWKRGND